MHIAKGLTVGALALTASLGVASAQMPEGRLYVLPRCRAIVCNAPGLSQNLYSITSPVGW